MMTLAALVAAFVGVSKSMGLPTRVEYVTWLFAFERPVEKEKAGHAELLGR